MPAEQLPTIEQAEALAAIARHGSYEDAAEELGVTRTALIRRIDRLQTLIDRGPLLKRGGRARTPVGELVLTQAERVLEAARGMVRLANEVRLSTYPTIAAHVVAACPALFDAEDAPVALYDINEGSRRDGGARLIRQLAEGDVDVVIAPARHRRLGLEATKLYPWTLQIFLAEQHPLRRRAVRHAGLSVSDVMPLRLVATPRTHSSRQILEEMFADEEASPRVAFESPDQRLLQQLALSSQRYAAAIPSDAFWPSSEPAGIDLVGTNGQPQGGWYDVFTRQVVTDQENLTVGERDAEIKSVVDAIVSGLGRDGADDIS